MVIYSGVNRLPGVKQASSSEESKVKTDKKFSLKIFPQKHAWGGRSQHLGVGSVLQQ